MMNSLVEQDFLNFMKRESCEFKDVEYLILIVSMCILGFFCERYRQDL